MRHQYAALAAQLCGYERWKFNENALNEQQFSFCYFHFHALFTFNRKYRPNTQARQQLTEIISEKWKKCKHLMHIPWLIQMAFMLYHQI